VRVTPLKANSLSLSLLPTSRARTLRPQIYDIYIWSGSRGFSQRSQNPQTLDPLHFYGSAKSWRARNAGVSVLDDRVRLRARGVRRAMRRRHRRRCLPAHPVRYLRGTIRISPRRPQPPRRLSPLFSRCRSLAHRAHHPRPRPQHLLCQRYAPSFPIFFDINYGL
jgi:hypothetical protein